jgi:hypothetical protein
MCVVNAASLPSEEPCIRGQDDLVDCRLCADGNAMSSNPCNRPFLVAK